MRPALSLSLLLGLTVLVDLGCSSSTDTSLPTGDVAIVVGASTKGSAAFSPNPFSESFATRAKVIWVNGDRTGGGYGSASGVTHHLVSDTGLFDSGLLAPGRSYSFTFAGNGSYAFHCSIHPTMVGSITITP